MVHTMITATKPPIAVGVAPGTTTFQLAGPQATCSASPARIAYERMRERPPWSRRVNGAPPVPAGAPPAAEGGKGARVGAGVRARLKAVLDPYSTLESLRGVRLLGNPTREIVASGKGWTACRADERLSKVNDFRADETSSYGSQMTDQEPFGEPSGLGTPGYPTDRQLSTIWGYTPYISGQIPFKEGAWAPAPWVPPDGGRPGYIQAFRRRVGLGEAVNAGAVPSPDVASATLQTLQAHQDRMYFLGIISAAAVASTAMINVFRYAIERRDARKKGAHTKVAAEPSAIISGYRRHIRRHARRPHQSRR